MASSIPSLANAEWLRRPATTTVLAALQAEGAEARVVGGAVRNALMGLPVKDVDVATNALPAEVTRLAAAAGLQAVPTGFEHGTVTVIAKGAPIEVTTLRRDIETFGRHARVTFTQDWSEDARRRDFTMNALYCTADGTVHDPLDGYPDVVARRVRFIGDARERIREDYLRILRFFRFFATYDLAPTPDANGLAAAVAEKAGMARLSGERIRAELLLLLVARRAVDAIRIMDKAGLIEAVLGHRGDVDRLERLVAIEATLNRAPDALLRLAALALNPGSDAARLQERLRLSTAEAARLAQAGVRHAAFSPSSDEREAQGFIYRHGREAFIDGALLAWAASPDAATDAKRAHRARLADRWEAPELPVRGADVLALGAQPGPEVGRVISAFEAWWIAQGFPVDRERAKAKLGELLRG